MELRESDFDELAGALHGTTQNEGDTNADDNEVGRRSPPGSVASNRFEFNVQLAHSYVNELIAFADLFDEKGGNFPKGVGFYFDCTMDLRQLEHYHDLVIGADVQMKTIIDQEATFRFNASFSNSQIQTHHLGLKRLMEYATVTPNANDKMVCAYFMGVALRKLQMGNEKQRKLLQTLVRWDAPKYVLERYKTTHTIITIGKTTASVATAEYGLNDLLAELLDPYSCIGPNTIDVEKEDCEDQIVKEDVPFPEENHTLQTHPKTDRGKQLKNSNLTTIERFNTNKSTVSQDSDVATDSENFVVSHLKSQDTVELNGRIVALETQLASQHNANENLTKELEVREELRKQWDIEKNRLEAQMKLNSQRERDLLLENNALIKSNQELEEEVGDLKGKLKVLKNGGGVISTYNSVQGLHFDQRIFYQRDNTVDFNLLEQKIQEIETLEEKLRQLRNEYEKFKEESHTREMTMVFVSQGLSRSLATKLIKKGIHSFEHLEFLSDQEMSTELELTLGDRLALKSVIKNFQRKQSVVIQGTHVAVATGNGSPIGSKTNNAVINNFDDSEVDSDDVLNLD